MFVGKTNQNLGKTRSKAIPACIGGWNAHDSLADMKETDAVILDNYFPDGTKITQRRGYASHATGMSGNVFIMTYSPTSGTQKLIAANGGKTYDISSAGAIGTALGSGYSVNDWQWTNMGTSGGQFLLGFNGTDTPFVYDGTTWGNTTITGPTVANLIWGNVHQNRLWVGEKNSLIAHYGGVNSIGGAFTAFPLYSVATLGGYIMGMATWTRDGGSGSDDVAVFVTSEGEAIVYSGTDPSSASTWSLIGVFRIGKPIGRKFWNKAGADAILITEDGFLSMATMLGVDRSQSEKAAISAKINIAVNSAVEQYKANTGWQALVYPAGKMLIFNIPISATESHQYVFNTITKAPCRFKNMNAVSWAIANDKLYFGGHDGIVYRADYGTSDNEANIDGDVFPAFSYFGTPAFVKKFNLVEVVFEGEADIVPTKQLNTDFKIPEFISSETAVVFPDAALWDEAVWDEDVWSGGIDIYRRWESVSGIGRSASLRIKTSQKQSINSIISINYIYQIGGFLR